MTVSCFIFTLPNPRSTFLHLVFIGPVPKTIVYVFFETFATQSFNGLQILVKYPNSGDKPQIKWARIYKLKASEYINTCLLKKGKTQLWKIHFSSKFAYKRKRGRHRPKELLCFVSCFSFFIELHLCLPLFQAVRGQGKTTCWQDRVALQGSWCYWRVVLFIGPPSVPAPVFRPLPSLRPRTPTYPPFNLTSTFPLLQNVTSSKLDHLKFCIHQWFDENFWL